jgi:hypothetical protein
MELGSLLSENKTKIFEEWLDLAVRAYPPETAKFIKAKSNRFANPVGYNFSAAMDAVLDYLAGQREAREVLDALEGLVKIKAVQNFSASQAVRFIFLLKDVVRKRAGGPSEELLEFESRVDETALACFDIYMRSREKLYDMKASELRSMHYRLLEKANLASRKDGSGQDPDRGNGS